VDPSLYRHGEKSAWHANELVLLLLLAYVVSICTSLVLQAQGKLWEMTSAWSEEVERIHAGMRELVCRRYKHVDLERIANGEVGEVEEVHPQEDPTYRQHLNSLRYHCHPPSQQQIYSKHSKPGVCASTTMCFFVLLCCVTLHAGLIAQLCWFGCQQNSCVYGIARKLYQTLFPSPQCRHEQIRWLKCANDWRPISTRKHTSASSHCAQESSS